MISPGHLWAGTRVEVRPRERGMCGGASENCLLGPESQEGLGSRGESRVSSYGRSSQEAACRSSSGIPFLGLPSPVPEGM